MDRGDDSYTNSRKIERNYFHYKDVDRNRLRLCCIRYHYDNRNIRFDKPQHSNYVGNQDSRNRQHINYQDSYISQMSNSGFLRRSKDHSTFLPTTSGYRRNMGSNLKYICRYSNTHLARNTLNTGKAHRCNYYDRRRFVNSNAVCRDMNLYMSIS